MSSGNADAPWTLLYTSGSTGKPKGVIITRTGAMWRSLNLALMNHIGADAVMLCDTPLFHTVGLFGIARTALQTGATLLLSDRFDRDVTLARLNDPLLGITHYFCVPQLGQMLIDAPGFATSDLSRLQVIIMGGAPLPPSIVLTFADRGVPVANGFRMTEACSVMHMPHDLARIRERPTHVGYAPPASKFGRSEPMAPTSKTARWASCG
ncbi:MAG: AMP-binding protein [Pseudomonadota bacterium]